MFVRSSSVSTAAVMNLPMWNPTLMNSGSLARDSSTCEYHHVDFPTRGTEESPLREGPPKDPSPNDRGLGEVVLGDSAGFRLGGTPADLGLEAAFKGGDGAPPTPGELCVPPGLRGFEDSGAVFSAPGVRGLSTIGDKPPVCTSCMEESGLMY
jgi:hypothetical protein